MDQAKTDEATRREGSGRFSEGLGLAPERAAFARWCRENGHGELDDMLTPLDRSLRALMWPVWQGASAAERERCGQVYGSREVAMTAELGRLRAELADALHAMRAYARENPRHEYQGATQDPNGVHAWLARNDKA